MIKDDNSSSTQINYEEFLKLPYLEIREALHIFLGRMNFDCWIGLTGEQKGYIGRNKLGFIDTISLKGDYKKKFDKLYSYLNERVLNGDINSIFLDTKIIKPEFFSSSNEMYDNVFIFCRRESLINWALSIGIVFPKELQCLLKICQVERKSLFVRTSEIQRICLQALAQVLWHIYPENSQPNIIDLMDEVIFKKSRYGKKVELHFYVRYVKTPLDHLLIDGRKKYFDPSLDPEKDQKDPIAKHTSLLELIKEVDPTPEPLKQKKHFDNIHGPFPPRWIPVTILKQNPIDKIDFVRLQFTLQTIGYYLYGLGQVSDLESSLEHPLIQFYIEDQGDAVQKLAFLILQDVCPTRLELKAEKQVLQHFAFDSQIKSFSEQVKKAKLELKSK